MVTTGAIINESQNGIAKFAVLQHLIHDVSRDITGARNQNPLQSDTGTPAALKDGAQKATRAVAAHDTQDKVDGPCGPRNLVDSLLFDRQWHKISLIDQRPRNAKDTCQQTPDEDSKELVYPRSHTPGAIRSLRPETKGQQRTDKWSKLQVMYQLGLPLWCRNKPRLEA